jgi:hypothetical protein
MLALFVTQSVSANLFSKTMDPIITSARLANKWRFCLKMKQISALQ